MKNKKTKMSYDPQSDVLRVELSKKPIDYATEMGNLVVHFDSQNTPVYVEVVEARKFLSQTGRVLGKYAVPKISAEQ